MLDDGVMKTFVVLAFIGGATMVAAGGALLGVALAASYALWQHSWSVMPSAAFVGGFLALLALLAAGRAILPSR